MNIETLNPLTKDELILLSKMIDRLDNEITLESRTVSDIRLSISECHFRRNKTVNATLKAKESKI